MPTAAKLVAALSFALFAWVVATLYWQYLPQDPSQSWGREICAGLGLWGGWWIMGGRVPRARNLSDAMGTGMRTAFTITLAALVVFACGRVLDRAFMGRYDDPMQAVLAVFKEVLALGQGILHPDVLGAILIFGLIGGALALWAGRRWR